MGIQATGLEYIGIKWNKIKEKIQKEMKQNFNRIIKLNFLLFKYIMIRIICKFKTFLLWGSIDFLILYLNFCYPPSIQFKKFLSMLYKRILYFSTDIPPFYTAFPSILYRFSLHFIPLFPPFYKKTICIFIRNHFLNWAGGEFPWVLWLHSKIFSTITLAANLLGTKIWFE